MHGIWTPCHALHIQSEILLLDDRCGAHLCYSLAPFPSFRSPTNSLYFDLNVECTIEINEKAPDTMCAH